jgi:hypothetical protein
MPGDCLSATRISSLGFKGTPCCRAPCPVFPLNHVRICFRVNSISTLRIQQGCLAKTNYTTYSGTTCNVVYETGITEDSWGRRCRLVTFDRKVPTDSFIRLRVCALDAGCSPVCGESGDALVSTNQLVNFEINGVKIIRNLRYVQENGGVQDCVKVGCTNPDPEGTDCCNTAGTWDLTQDVPFGAEIVVGPIGGELFSTLI